MQQNLSTNWQHDIHRKFHHIQQLPSFGSSNDGYSFFSCLNSSDASLAFHIMPSSNIGIWCGFFWRSWYTRQSYCAFFSFSISYSFHSYIIWNHLCMHLPIRILGDLICCGSPFFTFIFRWRCLCRPATQLWRRLATSKNDDMNETNRSGF